MTFSSGRTDQSPTSNVENVRSPTASRREILDRFYGTLTCRLRPEFPAFDIDCGPRLDLVLIYQDRAEMDVRQRRLPVELDRIVHLSQGRMSLRRNDIATLGGVRTNMRHCWPQSVRAASDDRVGSAAAAGPPSESMGTGPVHRRQA